jgi:TonB-dependent SusC/RagA subfamily outer membrane receptor
MEPLMLFLLKVNGVFAILFAFYLLLLRRDTFYATKRIYLQGIIFCSVLLPLLHVAALIPQKEAIQYVIILINGSLPMSKPAAQSHLGFAVMVDYLLMASIAATLFWVGMRHVQLFRVIRKCRVVTVNGVKVYVPGKEINPFSFWGKIYLNPALYSFDELVKIIEHERAHIDQKHEWDLLLVSLFQSLVWMNPLYYLFAASVRYNVEFLADKMVLKTGNDPKAYQYALLKVAQTASMPLTQHFSISHLKKRIIMMNKKKTHAMWTSKYLLVVPLLLTTVLLVNAGELKEAWANADLSDASSSTTMSPTTSASAKQEKKKVVVVQINNDSTKVHPLFLVDGKKVSEEAFKAIDPNKIQSVTVWKDSAAVSKYGLAGKNGVVVITIKGKEGTYVVVTQNGDKGKSSYVMTVTENKTSQLDSLSVDSGTTDRLASKVEISSSNEDNTNPLIIVDGIGTDYKAMNQIDPNTIESVTILKDASATKLYGAKGKHGVILITLKKKIESN